LIDEKVAPPAEFELIIDWQSTTPEHAAAIKAFWLGERALYRDDKAQERLPQVVIHAQDRTGAIVAVCTADTTFVPRLGQPMYYYRSYVAAAWRKHGIALAMLQRSQQCLGDYARSNGYPSIGIVLEIQSEQLRDLGNQPVWPRTRFSYIGHIPTGAALFVWYFEGATLKS
jgi:hypothetical protein